MNKKNKRGTKDRKIIFSSVTALYLFCALVVVVGFITLLIVDKEYSFQVLFQDLLGNLIGVLTAFLLFDILYNKLTKDAYAEEVSSQISKTIMGDPDVLGAFSDEDRMNFIHSTIRSVDSSEESLEMMDGKIKQYLGYDDNDKKFKLFSGKVRTTFGYKFDLDTEMPSDEYKMFPKDRYYYVQEFLEFTIRGPKDINGKRIVASLNQKSMDGKQLVKMALLFDKKNLDNTILHENVAVAEYSDDERKQLFSNCIFTESLDIDEDGLEYLVSLNEDKDKIYDLFTPVIRIDNDTCTLQSVKLVDDYGMLMYFEPKKEIPEKEEHFIKLVFHMPKLWNSIIEATLVDPTRSPRITLDYKPNRMDVSMYPYLNTEEETNDGAYEETNGLYDIAIKDGEWVYPKSGVVFYVRKKKKETVNE